MARIGIIGGGLGLGHGGVRLVGGGAMPYDAIPSIAAAYGMRRLRSAYTGNLLRLRRDSDNAESNFGYVANGDLDAAAIGTWLGAASGYVTTWYDQSGNAYNVTQTTVANQPLYVASGQNGKPVARFDGTNDDLVHATFDGLSSKTGISRLITGKVSAATGNHVAFFTGSAGIGLQQDASNNYCYVVPGQYGYVAGISTAWRVTTTRFDGSGATDADKLKLYINGSLQTFTGTAGTPFETQSAPTAGLTLASADGVALWEGDMAELIASSIAWSDAQRQAAEAATNAYWGVY